MIFKIKKKLHEKPWDFRQSATAATQANKTVEGSRAKTAASSNRRDIRSRAHSNQMNTIAYMHVE